MNFLFGKERKIVNIRCGVTQADAGICSCVLRSLAVVGAVSSGRSAVGERSTGVLYRPAVVYKLLAFL